MQEKKVICFTYLKGISGLTQRRVIPSHSCEIERSIGSMLWAWRFSRLGVDFSFSAFEKTASPPFTTVGVDVVAGVGPSSRSE